MCIGEAGVGGLGGGDFKGCSLDFNVYISFLLVYLDLFYWFVVNRIELF